MQFKTINPYTNETIARYDMHNHSHTEAGIERSEEAFQQWRKRSVEDRCKAVRHIAGQLEDRKEDLALLMTREMGKRKAEAVGELEKCIWLIEYFCDNGPSMLADVPVETEHQKSYISYQPMGPILCIMPWNYPFWQVFRFAIPALIAGNSVILKHAPSVLGCGEAIADLFDLPEFPKGLFQHFILNEEATGDLIDHRLIRGVSLTGSTAAGQTVAGRAGKALKKCVLELGGSDPYLIMGDADLELAVDNCVRARLQNTGQSCIAAKRFLVHDSIYDKFVEDVRSKFEDLKPGDPASAETGYGPMASHRLRDLLHQQVQASVNAGAHCICGGFLNADEGAFYPPTILTSVEPGMPAYDEELFGPVATIIKFDSASEAIRIANDTSYGLGAAIFSHNTEEAERLIREELECGCGFVNGMVRSDPRLPFGGIRDSGLGRELSTVGIREFCNIKTIVVT